MAGPRGGTGMSSRVGGYQKRPHSVTNGSQRTDTAMASVTNGSDSDTLLLLTCFQTSCGQPAIAPNGEMALLRTASSACYQAIPQSRSDSAISNRTVTPLCYQTSRAHRSVAADLALVTLCAYPPWGRNPDAFIPHETSCGVKCWTSRRGFRGASKEQQRIRP